MWKSLIFVAACVVIASGGIVKRQAQPCPDECENIPMDISLIVDSSSSIWKSNFTLGKNFLENFVDKFEIGSDRVRFSMVTFGDRVYREDAFNFDTHDDKLSLKLAIAKMPYHAGRATETGMAIKWFLDNQHPNAREGVRTVVIVLTDGNSQRQEVTKTEAAKAHEMGLEVFVIGVGHAVSQEELYNIASSGEHVFVVNDYNALNDIESRLAYETCGVKPHPICSHSAVDVSFVIDSSRSIGANNFEIEKRFIRNFLEVFKINPSSARVAAIMFGDRVYAEKAIQFDQFKDEKETLDAIINLDYMAGSSTETGAGIEYMINNFAPKFRSHAARIAIIITDGQSQQTTRTRKAAASARENGITTVAVGVGKIGDGLSQKELDDIAGDRSRVITADDFDQLNAIREDLIDITCEGVQADIQTRGK